MHKILIIITVLLFSTIFLSGCIKSFEENESAAPRPASCNECHTVPGSNYCRSDTMNVSGKTVTSCVLCHMGGVKLDSTVTTVQIDTLDTTITVYHDLMLSFMGNFYTATDSLHTNDAIDVNFGQCTKCHGYPPNKDGHELHVIDKKKKCTDCHLFSIQCSTYILLDKTIYVPRKHKGLGKDSLLTPDPNKHLNGMSGDIAFKQKEENKNNPDYDTLFIWDPKERSCSNVRCHPPWHPKKLFWKEVKRK